MPIYVKHSWKFIFKTADNVDAIIDIFYDPHYSDYSEIKKNLFNKIFFF
jgi:hypothetical protein